MKTLQFKTVIAAPAEKVWDTMIDRESYPKWTEPFCDGSYFEGSWSQGERIRFLAPSGGGMVAVIAENRPHELISIKHIGVVKDGVDDTTSDAVKSWAPAYEKYWFTAVPGGTEVTIEQDVDTGFEKFMTDAWPKALAELKTLCETERLQR